MAFDWRVLGTALSSGIENYQNQRALGKARDDVMAGQAAVAAQQAAADQRVRDTVESLRASRPEPIQQRNMVDYATAIRRTRAADDPSLPSNLGGERYQGAVAANNQAAIPYADRVAGLVSRIEAPAMQRTQEAQTAARAGLDIRGLSDKAETAQYLAQLRARRRQPNPLIMALARAGQQISANYEPAVPSDGLEEITVDAQRLPMPGPSVWSQMRPMPDALQEIDLNTLPKYQDMSYRPPPPKMMPFPKWPGER